jgi:C4-dicarboxylate-specific signal transduction histidine kinase
VGRAARYPHAEGSHGPVREFIAREFVCRGNGQVAAATHDSTVGLGELAASIVHEVNQTLPATKHGETSLRWLDGDRLDSPRARKSIERVLQDVGRALDIVSLIRAVATGHTPQHSRLTIEEVIS